MPLWGLMGYVFGLHGSREAEVQAKVAGSESFFVSEATYEIRGSDPTVL